MQLQPLMELVAELAEKAGRKVMTYFEDHVVVEVNLKPDYTPVTQADFEAHKLIIEGLQQFCPDVPIISEEDKQLTPVTAAERFWLVDPLDGTREFIHHRKEFSVNVALIENGYPVLGVIHLPAFGETFMAAEGIGCFKVRNGKRRQMHSNQLDGPRRVNLAVSKRLPSKEIKYCFRRFDEHFSHVIREPMGSSIKFCLLAEGKADAYPGLAEMSLWDCAAGQALVEQAGGAMFDREGQRIAYSPADSLLMTPFIAVGDSSYPWDEVAPFINKAAAESL